MWTWYAVIYVRFLQAMHRCLGWTQYRHYVMQFMEIPDLEGADDMSRQVATAPAVRSVSVMDIAELESEDLFRLPVVAKDHEVDLSLLTACLCPADEVTSSPCSV